MSYQKRFYLTGSINEPTVEDAYRVRRKPAAARGDARAGR